MSCLYYILLFISLISSSNPFYLNGFVIEIFMFSNSVLSCSMLCDYLNDDSFLSLLLFLILVINSSLLLQLILFKYSLFISSTLNLFKLSLFSSLFTYSSLLVFLSFIFIPSTLLVPVPRGLHTARKRDQFLVCTGAPPQTPLGASRYISKPCQFLSQDQFFKKINFFYQCKKFQKNYKKISKKQ